MRLLGGEDAKVTGQSLWILRDSVVPRSLYNAVAYKASWSTQSFNRLPRRECYNEVFWH